MRLLTWNIFNGGEDGPDGHTEKRPEAPQRLKSVASVIRREAPDVVVLLEANHFDADDGERLRWLADQTGMSGFLSPAKHGFHVAIYVPVGASVIATKQHSHGLFHSAAELTASTTDGELLTVVGYHGSPISGADRLEEAKVLAPLAGRKHPLLLTGDLNSLDDVDDHTSAVEALPPYMRSRHCRPGRTEDGGIEVDVDSIRHLKAAGFVDIFRAVGHSAPPTTVPTPRYARVHDEFTNMRLDYALANPALAMRLNGARATVLRDPITDNASDHYPLLVDIPSLTLSISRSVSDDRGVI